MFDTLDVDGSGEMDRDEFFAMCENFGFSQSREDAESTQDKVLRDAFSVFDREGGEEVSNIS